MFDVIVVGARCGGSPTAMLLARQGHRVLLIDRARFPSDTLSTHWIWTPGIACLKRYFFRKPYGNGWALVGDAGYHKDPILAQGISDAFRSAEWLADAVHAGLSGLQPLSESLAEYQRTRDEHFLPMYNFNFSQASLQPPPPEMVSLFAALRNDPLERSRFFGTLAGSVPIQEYYAPENLQRIIGKEA